MVAIVGLGVAVPSYEITRVYIGDKARSKNWGHNCMGKPTFIGELLHHVAQT